MDINEAKALLVNYCVSERGEPPPIDAFITIHTYIRGVYGIRMKGHAYSRTRANRAVASYVLKELAAYEEGMPNIGKFGIAYHYACKGKLLEDTPYDDRGGVTAIG